MDLTEVGKSWGDREDKRLIGDTTVILSTVRENRKEFKVETEGPVPTRYF